VSAAGGIGIPPTHPLPAAPVLIRHFTDPSCPWAFSAERQRLRLLWLYGEQIAWELHMVVLSETPPEGMTPETVSAGYRRLAVRFRMPIDWSQRVRVAPSVHACRAVVATRLRWPEREAAMLRRLRVLHFAGELLDDSDTLEIAAAQAGLPVAELAASCAEPEVEAALRADMAIAAGRRCGESAGDVAGLATRPAPASAADVLDWAGMPLTADEVAAVCGRDIRAELERTAVDSGGYWSLDQPLRYGST
jgi:predicted DsbA family dithiol-disulfide isomerase